MKNQTTAPSDDTNGCSTLNDLFTLYGFVCGSTKRQSGHKTEENICESSVCLPALKAFLSDPFEKIFETATTWSDVWDCFLFSVFLHGLFKNFNNAEKLTSTVVANTNN